ncbi:hypothetical protein F4776DRAFT_670171 [Hypoxylon sp. NC0597]|nr:hypothetical protein F4776DRAFT_670171 [Hypoxylon sp. NC0597]
MAESEHSTSSTSTLSPGIIKVYATTDGSSEDWTRPRRIHLHEKISPNETVCCESVTAGGIVEDQDGRLFYLTSDKFVPGSAEERDRHTETEDGDCTCIGNIKHTSRVLRYALVSINGSVADVRAIERAKNLRVPVSGQLSFEAAMHPAVIRYHHRNSDLVVLARTPHNDIFVGRIATLPSKVVRPSFLGSGDLMVAKFDPWPPRQLEAGMWVYARRPGAISFDLMIAQMLKRPDHGPYPSKVFSYHPNNISFDHGNPLVLIGHIVEVRGCAAGPEGQTEVTIQGAYEVLTEIFVQHGRLNHPDGAEPIPAGVDPLYVDMVNEIQN